METNFEYSNFCRKISFAKEENADMMIGRVVVEEEKKEVSFEIDKNVEKKTTLDIIEVLPPFLFLYNFQLFFFNIIYIYIPGI